MEESCQPPLHGGGYPTRRNCEYRIVDVRIPQCMSCLYASQSAQSDQEGFQTLNLLNLLPTICCSSPRDVALEIQQQLGIIQCTYYKIFINLRRVGRHRLLYY